MGRREVFSKKQRIGEKRAPPSEGQREGEKKVGGRSTDLQPL